jgi:Ca2+-binding EF-hand superfamily protein
MNLECVEIKGDVVYDCTPCDSSNKCHKGAADWGKVANGRPLIENVHLPDGDYKEYCGECEYDHTKRLLKCNWCTDHEKEGKKPQSLTLTSNCRFVKSTKTGELKCETKALSKPIDSKDLPGEAEDIDTPGDEPDLMDTAQDMAETMVDVPAKDIKSVDDTTKVLGETVFKDGIEEMEELQAEDPFLEQPIEDLEKETEGLTAKEKEELKVIENQLKSADEKFEEEESHDAATEAVLASRKQTMKDVDTNADGVLDEGEVEKEINTDMQEADEVSMLQQMKSESKGLQHLVALFDKNGDGALSFKELFGREPKAMQKMYQPLFKAADQDGSATLDAEELFDLHNLRWLAHWTQPKAFFQLKARDHLDSMDSNSDGGVDWQEFKTFMTPHLKEALEQGSLDGVHGDKGQLLTGEAVAEHLKSFKALFNEADLNHDGKLKLDELEKNLEEREQWTQLAAATRVIGKADDNNDKTLSLNEVISNADKFGAKTEDFFEDQDLLTVDEGASGDGGDGGAGDGAGGSEFVKSSLRGGKGPAPKGGKGTQPLGYKEPPAGPPQH